MNEEVYRRLREHLDRLPGGFAPSDTGADIRLLQLLFAPEEAALAVHLTLDREEAATIARRADLPLAEVEQRLHEMFLKGLISAWFPPDGSVLYQALQMVVGIYEWQVNNLTPEFLTAWEDYWLTRQRRPRVETIPQMRTIPVGQSLAPELAVLPWEQVDNLVDSHTKFGVLPCICRRHARLRGGGCDAPDESCLVFGEAAESLARSGRARIIDRDEVKRILAAADAGNRVLQPSNSKEAAFICTCCGCCCGVLGGLKRQAKPAEAVANAFIVSLEVNACQGCWACLERCQMDALSEDGDRVALNGDRCIGCGLCVSTCPSGALTLVRKPGGLPYAIPDTQDETIRIIAEAQQRARAA